MLKSFPTVKKAVNKIKQPREFCFTEDLDFTKWISNERQVIQSVPDDERKPNVRNELVTLGNLPEEKTLGVKLDTQNYTLDFYIKLANKQ